MLRVLAIEGEGTRYHVESNSLQCIKVPQKHLFNKRLKPGLAVGDPCPTCLRIEAERLAGLSLHKEEAGDLVPKLDLRFHMVDISKFFPVGQCLCEWFDIAPRPELGRISARQFLQKMNPRQIELLPEAMILKLRCQHINAAREFSLDLTVKAHERHRLGGRMENE